MSRYGCLYNSMYHQLLDSYYSKQYEDKFYLVNGSEEIVVANDLDGFCNIFENAKECFELGVMETIEIRDEPEDVDFYFDEEEIEFILENYPDREIAKMIKTWNEEQE